jgi:hypothetical protein
LAQRPRLIPPAASGAWEDDNSTDVSRAMVLHDIERLLELADSIIDAHRAAAPGATEG